MTELSQQINRIRTQNSLSVAPVSQGRPSLFLSAKEAAGIDIDQVYDAAINGLKVLCQYDGRLSAFQDGLLHPSSMTVQRELKTAAENLCLDKEITILLEHLSIFASEPSAHLILEYLIRRYRIHEFNFDPLIRCLLSTHDSKIFARAVQLCTVKDTNWTFLGGVKSSGSPLPRSVIVARCVRDTSLLNAICQISRSALALLSVDGNSKPKSAVIAGVDRILSFLTATVVELADKGSLNDEQLRILYPFLSDGLKKSTEGLDGDKNGSKIIFRPGGCADQWRRSSCMIIAQICRKTKLAKPLLKTLIGSLMTAFVNISGLSSGISSSTVSGGVNSTFDAAIEVMIVVAIMAQYQKVTMGPKMLMAIFSDISVSSNSSIEMSGSSDSTTPTTNVGSAYILQCLHNLSTEKGFETAPLFKAFSTTLTAALVTNIADEMKDDPRYLSPMMASKILSYFISTGLLLENTIGFILWTILQNNSLLGHLGTGIFTSPVAPPTGRRPRAESFSGENDGDRKEVLRVLRCASQRYPSIFDQCVQAAYKAVIPTNVSDDAIVVVVDEDDRDDEDDVQIGQSLAQLNAEKLAKATLLRQLLSDTFTDAPYRMPSDTGVSLMLSLNSTSPLFRVQALEAFAVTLPDVCESTPDVRGLAQAASLSLTDTDYAVAVAAWDSPVISRIASHIPAQDLLESAINAYNWWSDCMSRVPVRASKVLAVLISSLAEPTFANAICSAQTDAFGATVKGSEWLFVTVLNCASFGLSSSQKDAVEVVAEMKVSPAAKSLQNSALRCAEALGQRGIVELFKDISAPSSVSAGRSAVHEIIALSVAQSLITQSVNTRFEALHSASLYFISKEKDNVIQRARAGSYITFLDLVSKRLEALKVTNAQKATLSLQLCSTLSAMMISRYIRVSDLNGLEVSSEVTVSLKDLITRCKVCGLDGSTVSEGTLLTVPDLVSEVSKEASASDVCERLLLTILGSRSASVAALVGTCIGHLFAKRPIISLLRIALSGKREGGVHADDSNLYSPLMSSGQAHDGSRSSMSAQYLHVGSHAKASAISALAQYVIAISGSKSISLSSAQSTMLITIAPVAIGACCDEVEMVRTAGLELAKALSTIRTTLTIHAAGSSKASIAGSAVHAVSMTVKELIILGEHLSGSAAVILNDYQALPMILAKRVFAESSSSSKSKVLADSLLALATVYGWEKASITIPIITAASAAPLNTIWKYLQSLLMHQSCSNEESTKLSTALMRCLATVHESSSAVKGEIVSCFCELISKNGTKNGDIKNDILKVLGEGWAMDFTNKERSQIFTALLHEQVKQPGREEILLAIQSVPIDLSTAALLIEEGTATFLTAYRTPSPALTQNSSLVGDVVRAFEGQSEGFDDETESILPSGLSKSLQCFCSIVEALQTVLSAGKVIEEEEVPFIRATVASLLDVFLCLNDVRLKALLSVEYAKTLVADTVYSCLTAAADVSALFSNKDKEKTKKVKKGVEKDKVTNLMFAARVPKDVEQVLLCIGSAQSLQLQKASLRLLRTLIVLCPSAVTTSVNVLGSLLASPSISAHLLAEGKDGASDGLVKEILHTLVATMPSKSNMAADDASGYQFLPQDILQPLCTRFLSIPSSRRSVLIRMAMDALGPCALPACTSVLLSHSVSSFVHDKEEEGAQGESHEFSQGNQQGGLILLSRSSQRKASRSLKSSQPEELFRLAMDSVLTKSAQAQVGALVALVKSVQQLLKCAAGAVLHEEPELDSEDASELILVEIDGVGEMLLDVGKAQSYCETLASSRHAERKTAGEALLFDKKGSAAASLLLQLEFVFEVLENKTFHRQLLPLIEAESGSDTLQSYFLELSEQVLQLLALSTRAQASAPSSGGDKKKHVHNYLSVQLGDSVIEITVDALGKNVGTWCLDILKATQKVLDAPSFVAILQELLSHEDSCVRQTALQILSKRLLAMSQGKRPGAEERALFLDLTTHLRGAVRGCLSPAHTSSSMDDSEDKDPDQDRLGIAQSALMCLDILAKYLGSSPNWVITLADTLAEVVTFSSQVVLSVQSADTLRTSTPTPTSATATTPSKSKKSKKATVEMDIESVSPAAIAAAKQSYPELLKLQGSVFLTAGTICGTVGPRGLPFLSELLKNILSTVEIQGAQLLADEKLRTALLAAQHAANLNEIAGKDLSPEEESDLDPSFHLSGYNYTVHRSRLLLLRSSVAAISTIIAELSSFFHPYILRTLSATLKLRCIHTGRRNGDSDSKKIEDNSSKKSKFSKRGAIPLRDEKQVSKEAMAQQAAEAHSAEIRSLGEDIDRCLSVMSSAIPPRLSVPILLQGAPSILSLGHGVAEKFARLLGSVWDKLDRPTVLQHMASLSSLATLALDYRRAHGDQSEAAEEVDIAACSAVAQLCFKLTESELKILLANMAEWRDFERIASSADSEEVYEADGTWQKYSRGVTYYRLISQLATKLRSIFLPSMGVIWANAAAFLQDLTEHSSIASREHSDRALLGDLSGQKNKKRKADKDSNGAVGESADAVSRRKASTELVQRSEHVLSSVKAACVHDSEGFIDETRYGLMMPATADLIALRDAFDCDADYLFFVERHVCTCLSALARAVGKDVLWKPLNHRVLLLTRDSRKSVRIAAVKSLHKLFIEVGEEYLLLLPECLPFLSELLEDDASDVTSQTGELIRYIEELSGEKLDAYLQ